MCVQKTRKARLFIPFILSVGAVVILLLLLGGVYPPAGRAHTSRYDVSGTISTNTTWEKVYSPYNLTDDVIVAAGVILTIEEGVEVRGDDNLALTVHGHLRAQGTLTDPIVFTAVDESGPNQWSGLVFDGGTGDLQHVVVRYSGDRTDTAQGLRTSILVSNVLAGEVRIENSLIYTGGFSSQSDYGLYVQDSRVAVSGTVFWNTNDKGIGDSDYAVYVAGASSVITLTDNTFRENSAAARVRAGHLRQTWMTDNEFVDNDTNQVLIVGGTLEEAATLASQTGLEAYEVEGNLTVPTGLTLTVAPGVQMLWGANRGLQVGGRLSAIGTATQPITLTAANPLLLWSGVDVQGGSSALAYGVMQYAGDYGLRVDDGQVVVSQTVFSTNGAGSSDYVIDVVGSTPDLALVDNHFEDNDAYALRVGAANLNRVYLQDNRFSGAGDYGRRIRVLGGTLGGEAVMVAQEGLQGYELYSSSGTPLNVPAGLTLTVMPGVALIARSNIGVGVGGHLAALGTLTRPITFTADTPVSGWRGLVFDGGTGWLRHATVRYGGDDNSVGVRSNVTVQDVLDGNVRLEHSRLLDKNATPISDYGLYIDNSHVIISGTVFNTGGDTNNDYAMYVVGAGARVTATKSVWHDNRNGIGVEAGQVLLSCVAVTDNLRYGIQVGGGALSVIGSVLEGNGLPDLNNTTGVTVSASYNWWGSASGPVPGTDVVGQVDYTPYLSAPGCVLDLQVLKSAWPEPVYVQDPLTYVLTVTNHSPAPASGVILTDHLPANVRLLSTAPPGLCSGTDDVVTCSLGALAGRIAVDYVPLSVTLVVTPQVAAEGVITNVAQVAGQELDPWTANTTVTLTTTVKARADLALHKADAPDPVGIGELLTYTLTLTNYGPSEAQGVVLTDDLPADVSLISAMAGQGTGCSVADQQVTCALGALADGATATATVVITVPSSGRITNTARVGSLAVDRLTANNTATVTTTVGSADLVLYKAGFPDQLRVGERLTYTLVVTNDGGPNDATHVTVLDTLPLSVTLDTSAVSQGTGCQEDGGRVTCNLGDLVIGARAALTLTAVTTGDGRLTNQAEARSFEIDPRPGDNTASTDTIVDPVVDLVAGKIGWPDPVGLAQPLTYTLLITNNGPSLARAVRLTDTLPLSVSQVLALASHGTCNVEATAGRVTCDLNRVPAAVTARVTLTLVPTATGPLANRVVVTSPAFDPETVKNSAAYTVTVVPAADLQVSKSDGPDPLAVGETLTYGIRVINHGPSVASDVRLTDTLPLSVTSVVAVSSQGLCDVTADAVTCQVGTLDLGAGAQVTLTVVPSETGVLVNDVEVGAVELDPHVSNNTAQASTTVGVADLALDKLDTPDPVLLGERLTYTLVITNRGPDPATAVRLTDTLPTDVTFVSAVTGQGECSDSPGTSVVTCTLDTLGVGHTVPVTLVVQPTVEGVLVNVARVEGYELDRDLANNRREVSTRVDPTADLQLGKRASPATLWVGERLTYTLVVTNAGPSTTTGVWLSDTLPTGVISVSVTPGQGRCRGSLGTPVVWCDLGTLGVGVTIPVTLVTQPTVEGAVVNTARAGANEFDGDLDNNVREATVRVDPVADLKVNKAVTPESLQIGQRLTYTILVTNVGPSAASGVRLTDTLPLSVTDVLTVLNPAQGTCESETGRVVCALDDLARDDVVTLLLSGEVTGAGQLVNQVTVVGNEADHVLTNNLADASAWVEGGYTVYLPLVLRQH